MLHKETVAAETFELLNQLQKEDITSGMRLVGGTSLALQIAHRRSTDLDLFSVERFDTQAALDMLIDKYSFTPSYSGKNAIVGFINGIKIDMIYHPYLWLEPVLEEGSIRMAGLKDIAAMKIHAIANSGERPKDFVDIAFLSKWFSYNQMKDLAIEKYPMYDPIMIDKSINYFDDVDWVSIDHIKMIGYAMDWPAIQRRLLSMTDQPDRVFARSPLNRN